MDILSLFDGISCGRLALERAGIKVDSYFASEIDKYAIQIAKKNYPDTVHIGSVTWVQYKFWRLFYNQESAKENWWSYPVDIHMIIWGSPCQDLSIAKKWGQWLQGEKSSLFFEYVRLLKEVKPKYFLLENVASMKKADKEEITRILTEIYPDTQCYLINSALVSAQNRKRLYWTNIQWVEQPNDKGILLKDILEENVDERFILNSEQINKMKFIKWAKTFFSWKKEWSIEFPMSLERKSLTVLTTESGLNRSTNCIRVWQFNSGGQWDRVYSTEWKSVSLSANGGGRGAKTGLYSIYNQAFHEDKAMSLWTNSQCPTAKTGQIVIQPPVIRKLTPIECERLQTIPDWYTEGVSNTQRYKAIWNGWTVDVIAHIFSFIK